MKVKINDVNIEWVEKGKTKYGKATVAYEFNGQQRSQNIMSFANPSVFQQVQELKGMEVEVTLTKNSTGYNEWSAVAPVGASGTPASTGTTNRVSGSNYETAEERAKRQVYIVKQSSLSAATNLLKTDKTVPSIEEVLKTAQVFTDFVFSGGTTDDNQDSTAQ